jgi:hypothetical protein
MPQTSGRPPLGGGDGPSSGFDRPVRHLNQVDLARRWNLSPRTLERWRWLRQGPPFLKLGGRICYRVDDVEAFEADQLQLIDKRTK